MSGLEWPHLLYTHALLSIRSVSRLLHPAWWRGLWIRNLLCLEVAIILRGGHLGGNLCLFHGNDVRDKSLSPGFRARSTHWWLIYFITLGTLFNTTIFFLLFNDGVQVGELLSQAKEKLLGVASDLRASARAYMFFDSAPIFVIESQSFQEALVLLFGPTTLLTILGFTPGIWILDSLSVGLR